MIFSNTDDYSIGSVATMTFFNESKDEYGDLFINFSDTDIPTFQSEDLKNYVINDNLKITSFVLPDESDVDFVTDNKQELNKEELAPEEIILAEDNPNKLGAIKNDDALTKATIPSTVYYVYNASGTKQGTYSNPFKAIEYLAKNKLDGYSIKQSNDSQEIFKLNLNSKNTFYKFQFTNYYGSTTSAAAAKDWTMGYSYAHVVRCDGIFGSNTDVRTAGQPYSHSYNSLLRVPELWALEGNTGAYVYRKSISYNGYRSTESTVNLSQAKLKFAADTPYNAYVYMSSNSNSSKGAISCDLGLICASTYGGDWYLISNRVQSGSTSNPGMYRPYSTPLVKSTFTGGEYKPTANVKLKYAYKSGSVYMIAQNLSTNLTQNVEIFDSRFDTSSPNICLMTGTSLVPNVKDSSNQMVASDIKSGAYLKNVVWTGNLIYTGTAWNGTSSAFNGGSNNATNYVVTYDTDNATYSSSGANETININYDPTYKQ